MSSPGFYPDLLNGGKASQAECDRLHFLKNRPDPPMINGMPIEYPPNPAPGTHAFNYPAAMYGPWTEDRKRQALNDTARAYGLQLKDPDQRAEAERMIYQWDTCLVENDSQKQRRLDDGWAERPDLVKEAQEKFHMRTVAIPSAEAAYSNRRMSDKAKAEFEAADRAAEESIVDLPAPKRKPGRPVKLKTSPVEPAQE